MNKILNNFSFFYFEKFDLVCKCACLCLDYRKQFYRECKYLKELLKKNLRPDDDKFFIVLYRNIIKLISVISRVQFTLFYYTRHRYISYM